MIRKGLVFIITDKIYDAFNYIMSKIPCESIYEIKNMHKQKIININGYTIIITSSQNSIGRACKPEISYVVQGLEDSKICDNIDLLIPMSILSTRKEPVRKIASLDELDTKEFIDDKYAEENYCDKRRLIWWDNIINPSPIDKHKWEREYNCTWIGEKD